MKNNNGMTLIELIIVVAIIGIIASIAYPSYSSYVITSKRADAQSALMRFAQSLERFYGIQYTYAGTGVDGDSGAPDPAVFGEASTPFGSTNVAYDLTLVVTATDYTVTATPVGSQASDTCGEMTLALDGAKTPPECW